MEKNKGKKVKYKIKRLRKFPIAIILTVAIAGLLATAALMTYYVQLEATIVAQPLFTWDDQPATNLSVTEDFTIYGNETHVFNHWLNYTADSTNGVIGVTFTWTGNTTIPDGISPSVEIDGTTVDSYKLSPGDNVLVNTTYYADYFITAETYNCILTIGHE